MSKNRKPTRSKNSKPHHIQHAAKAAVASSIANFDNLPASAHVRLPAVCALYAVGPATVWRAVKAGKIPAPKKISERVAAWNVGELRAALQRIAA